MYKLLFDSDALIKAVKAEFLEVASNTFDMFITDEVYDETVEEGRKRLYDDSDKIQNLIDNKKLSLIKSSYYFKKLKPKRNFGKGEVSVFQAYKKDYLIVTDDLSFASYLNEVSIKNISSGHLIIALLKKRKISSEVAYHYLENLKQLIRKEVYESLKEDIKTIR